MNRSSSTSSPQLSTRLWRGVTLQLFLFAVLPLTLLVLIVTFGSLQLHHDAMRSLVADRNLRAVQSAAASISKAVEHRGQTLVLVSKALAAGGMMEQFETELAYFEGGVAAFDATGAIQTSVGGSAIETFIDSADWPQIAAEVESAPVGSAAYLPTQEIDGSRFIPVVVRGANGLALVGLFSPETVLVDGLSVIARDEPVTILVVDSSHETLYQHGAFSPDGHLDAHPGIPEALEGASEIDFMPTIHGEHIITSSPIEPVGWALMIEESWEDIASPLLQATQNAPLIAIPILGLSVLALWFGLRQIVQPMQALEGKASDLARGDFESIRQPVGGVPEIQQLQGSLMDMAAQLNEAQSSLHSYIGAITESVENERRSLARELHDDTLQSLIALGQYTQYALHWNHDPKVEKTLDQVLNLAEDGQKSLRRVVQGLRPIYIEDLGLSTALAMQANAQSSAEGLEIHFRQEGKEQRLKPEIEMALYRIAQEALSNIARHAEARNAWVTLHFRPESVVLEILDDGKGFELPAESTHYARSGHYGLLGMHERADLIGAKLVIRSTPGEGTHIRVRLAVALIPNNTKDPTND